MQLHSLTRQIKNKKKKTVGRGGKRGTYSGRGQKGQLARAGNSTRPEFRDIMKKIPKKRGYKFNSVQEKPPVVNVEVLERLFSAGETVTPQALVEKKVVQAPRKRNFTVKILGKGALSKKLTVEGCLVSEKAAQKIEGVGGTVVKETKETPKKEGEK